MGLVTASQRLSHLDEEGNLVAQVWKLGHVFEEDMDVSDAVKAIVFSKQKGKLRG
jgi:hypothetical protein